MITKNSLQISSNWLFHKTNGQLFGPWNADPQWHDPCARSRARARFGVQLRHQVSCSLGDAASRFQGFSWPFFMGQLQ